MSKDLAGLLLHAPETPLERSAAASVSTNTRDASGTGSDAAESRLPRLPGTVEAALEVEEQPLRSWPSPQFPKCNRTVERTRSARRGDLDCAVVENEGDSYKSWQARGPLSGLAQVLARPVVAAAAAESVTVVAGETIFSKLVGRSMVWFGFVGFFKLNLNFWIWFTDVVSLQWEDGDW